jgi:hypothetical protein
MTPVHREAALAFVPLAGVLASLTFWFMGVL